MPSTATDRLNGLTTSLAIKPAVQAITNSNITLSGLTQPTLTLGSGISALSEDTRVLVKNQTDSTDNGIYLASTGDWTRAKDFDGNRDAVNGTLVVFPIAVGNGALYQVECDDDPIIIGTSEIIFSLRDNPNITYPQTEAEIAAGVTPINTGIASHDVSGIVLVDRYGTNATPGTTDMLAAALAARDVAETISGKNNGAIIGWLGNTYYLSGQFRQGWYIRSIGVGPGPTKINFGDAITGPCWNLRTDDDIYVFGSTIENIYIGTGNNASHGVYSAGAHQHSGLKRVTIANIRRCGFEFGSDGGPARLDLDDVWLEGATTAYPIATTLDVNEVTSDTVIGLTSTTGFEADQYVAIELDDGTYHQSRIASVNAGVSITIDHALPSDASIGNDCHVARVGGIINNGSINRISLLDVEGNATYKFDRCLIQNFGHVYIGGLHTEHSRDGIVAAAALTANPQLLEVGIATGTVNAGTLIRVLPEFIGVVRIGMSTGGNDPSNIMLLNEITGESYATRYVTNYEFVTPAGQNDGPAYTRKYMAMPHQETSSWANVGHVTDATITVAARVFSAYLMRDTNGGSPLNAAGVGFELDAGNFYNLILGAANSSGVMAAILRLRGDGYTQFVTALPTYADDAAAAAGGVPVRGLYRNGSVVMTRVA